jgi:hypothetical protein
MNGILAPRSARFKGRAVPAVGRGGAAAGPGGAEPERSRAPYNGAVLWLLPALLVAAAPAEPVEVGKADAKAVVDALKQRPLTTDQHDRLVSLGEAAAGGLAEDRLWVGWALVRAGRADLGFPLVRDGLAGARPTAEHYLKSLILSSSLGQDDLGRAIVQLAAGVDAKVARQWAKTVDEPPTLAQATKRKLGDLQATERTLAVDGNDLVVWVLQAPGAVDGTIVDLPDADWRIELPRRCQDRKRLKAAASTIADEARAGRSVAVVLPGVRGCDRSTGIAQGLDDLLTDLAAVAAAYPDAEWVAQGEAGALLHLLSATVPDLVGASVGATPLARPWVPAELEAPWSAFGDGVCAFDPEESLAGVLPTCPESGG